ncbi:thioredoxin 2 [Solimonas aquatica]|uniref:Thioredoxin 2 n=1 Tax=Solimonas aquatica TaxID=489703 RepID=A0A1H8ZMN4_9GAMM|nr:thioredoxin domain-containing protein [Solimonas aquatica]SEP65682.1 thioredoxin 2 [Solimonas aquatica]
MSATPAPTPALMHIACPRCGKLRDLPHRDWLSGANCNWCGGELHPLTPFELNTAGYAAQVNHSDGMIVVHFAERNCTPCIFMDAVFEQAARHRRDLRFAICHVEDEAALVTQLRIRNAPTLVCFDRGRELARISGTLSLGQLLDWLDRHQYAGSVVPTSGNDVRHRRS